MCYLEFYFRLIQFGFVFWVLELLSFFFSMIVKCYPIAYKDSLQGYNVILLYNMTWIIWCLTHDYILYFDASSSHFILYLSPKKGNYFFSLSLSLYICVCVCVCVWVLFILFCKFTLGWWIIVFFYNTILGLYDLVVFFFF